VIEEIRALLVRLANRPELAGITPETPLFGDVVALDSLTGTLLLREIKARWGVDVADEDINLDALATLGTLASFVTQRHSGAARISPGALPD
jgi:acyl carrier protein